MLQVVQNLKSGITGAVECPAPSASRGRVLIRSSRSLISAGTERMLVEFGRAGWIDKARAQPDKVRQVIEKIRTDGLSATIASVQSRLDQPLPLGYSNAGTVVEIGPGVSNLAVGDRVISNGSHGEFVSVPQNLCARIPEGVGADHACFGVAGAIALQGVRLADPSLGETVVVIGLGLMGLLTVQLLRANGCRVLGVDYDSARVELASSFGAEVVNLSRGEDPVSVAAAFSRGRGVDSVLITAATKSSDPVHQAALMCRKRGRIVLVGVSGLELSRDDFYEKEISFQVSCSYGAGRYDAAYESGQDYPFGFVRWTAQRNFEAFLDVLATGQLNLEPLITHRVPIDRAAEAYELLFSNEPHLGVVLIYDAEPSSIPPVHCINIAPSGSPTRSSSPNVGVIGAGNYAAATLLPALSRSGAKLKAIADSGGIKAAHQARKYGFETAMSDSSSLIHDPDIHAVFIATRHDSHAGLVSEALAAGKHVFVEKPLCLTLEQLCEIERQHGSPDDSGSLIMVGFNRRFAPHIERMKELLSAVREPKAMVMTVNAGAIPPQHWTQRDEGGGRILGEGCHFIDLLRFLAGSPIASVAAAKALPDGATITLTFADGSTGTFHYFSAGHKSYPKERLTVFCQGRVLELDNFIRLRGWGWKGFRKMTLWRQDKGHQACVARFLSAVGSGGPSPIPFNELVEVSRFAIEAASL